jgi:hypothetical protein
MWKPSSETDLFKVQAHTLATSFSARLIVLLLGVPFWCGCVSVYAMMCRGACLNWRSRRRALSESAVTRYTLTSVIQDDAKHDQDILRVPQSRNLNQQEPSTTAKAI